MNIEKTLKKNKINKIDFMQRAGYTSARNFKYAVKNNTALSDTLVVMLLEKSGINVLELLKEKIVE